VANTGLILGAPPPHGLRRAWIPGYPPQFPRPPRRARGISASIPAPQTPRVFDKTTRQQNQKFSLEQTQALRISILVLRIPIFKAGPGKANKAGLFYHYQKAIFCR
jgi:hypothetical protein